MKLVQFQSEKIRMSKTQRHFLALMRKNWITFRRNPCSAVCTFIIPILLMLIMVYLRSSITVKDLSSTRLLKLSHPLYTIQTKQGSIRPQKTSRMLQDFMLFDNYTDIFGEAYDVLYDYQSPAYLFPASCSYSVETNGFEQWSKQIAFVGQKNSVSVNIQNYLTALFKDLKWLNVGFNPEFKYYASKEALFEYIGSDEYLNPAMGVCFGFEVVENGPHDWAVQLYFDDQTALGGEKFATIPKQSDKVWDNSQNKPRVKDYEQYALDGYSFIQNVIANMILKNITANEEAAINIMAVPMQSQNVKVDDFVVFNSIFANLISILYIMPVFNTVFFIVKEKEQRAKESMRMMGMSDMPYWLSWFSYYTILNTVTALLATITLSVNLFENSNMNYVFLMIWLFGEAVFGEIVLIQSLLTKSKYAGIIAAVIYFALSFVNLLSIGKQFQPAVEWTLCLLPQFTMFQMVFWIFEFDSISQGINSWNLWRMFNSFCPGGGYIMFVVGGVFFLLLGLYFEAVFPTEYGTQKHPCFICMPSSYRCCRKQRQLEESEYRDELLHNDDDLEHRNLAIENYEPVQAEIARQELDGKYLRIENLKKTYDNGFQAVKGINLKIYQNQIFALLGQNGAGKSTTISMLTGLIEQTEGEAKVFNLDLFKQGQQVRQFMGVCPQHDVLFEYLTPKEHLSIFYDLKGGDPLKKDQEIVDLIRDVGLEDDKDKTAGSLSGGNRRKLSVAIAMCGGSKLVLLDEPTAGMDLGARRALWDMLKNYRSNKIIILTTHYMDEADVLGDRIGIMAKGQMMCLGSSLFLKKRFGAGYKLTMVKAAKEPNALILPYLQKNLGSAELIQEVSSEISFGVPQDLERKFKDFFKKFDEDLESLGLLSYGVSITTLEEVFLHINQEFGLELKQEDNTVKSEEAKMRQFEQVQYEEPQIVYKDEYAQDQSSEQLKNGVNYSALNDSRNSSLGSTLGSGRAKFSKITTDVEAGTIAETTERLVSTSSIRDNISALLTKRYHVYKRDRAGLICEVIVPFLIVLVGCSLTKISFTGEPVVRVLSPDLYPAPQRILMNENNVYNSGQGDVPPSTLFANLPQSSSQFSVEYVANNVSFTEFYNQTYSMRNVGSELPYRYGSYQVYRADNVSKQFSVNSFINLTSQDVMALFPQFMYESILKTASGDPNFNFQVTTVPFPTLQVLQARSEEANSLTYTFMVGVGIALIPCAMISFILKEREENLKHMQLISGMSLPAYWIANMIADIIKVFIPMLLIQLMSMAFNTNYEGVWVCYLLLPLALVPFTYVMSFMFSEDSNAQIFTLLIHFLVCVVLSTTVFFLQLNPQTFSLGDKLRWWFCIIPTYCVMNAIIWSSQGQKIIDVRETNTYKYSQLPTELWAFENLGGDVVMMLLHFFIDSGILALIEANAFSPIKRWLQKRPLQPDTSIVYDSDVLQEQRRVAECKEEMVRVSNFRKAYTKAFQKPFMAVENISFGLDYGECFALLGVNGAGKSTTFKSLTAGVLPSEGAISIGGYDIQTQFEKVRKLIGYCPQHDAIFPLMTVEEHLWFYARLKGIPESLRQKEIEKAIDCLNLADHREKAAGTLSGGNKRKLSVAMATLGNPPIILLDEPSAGMDPEARRFMWQVVANISQRDKNSAVIITTHSMEEAEALSTKMGIMVRGGIFKCFGSSQHIKSKFGTGFEVEIKIKKPSFQELQELAQKLGFVENFDDRIDLDDAKARASAGGITQLVIDQIKQQGLGSDIALEAVQGGQQVRVKNLINYFYTLQQGLAVIEFLCGFFPKVELYEQCSEFFKMRIPRENSTIGHLFGMIQEHKAKLAISEYAVSQTSLEQIFQTFANASTQSNKSQFVFQQHKQTRGLILLNRID